MTTVERLDGEFIGREPELALLRDLMVQASTKGGRLALLAGEAGIGKTRLAEQAAKEARCKGLSVFWGRSRESADAPPFWPWTELLFAVSQRGIAGRLGFGGRLAVAGSAEDSTERDMPCYPQWPPGAPLPLMARADSSESRFIAFEATARALEEFSHVHPIVLVLEDLHWADKGSLALLSYLAADLSRFRMLLIGTVRRAASASAVFPQAELVDLLRHRTTWQVPVERLQPSEVHQFILQVLGPDSAALLSTKFFHRSGGNPLFLVELLRSHLLGGESVDSSGIVPESILALITCRIANLSESARSLLDAASIIGARFDERKLARLAKLSSLQTVAAIQEMLQAGLIAEGDGYACAYKFSHDVVREAVYSCLSGIKRRLLHTKYAVLLEKGRVRGQAVSASTIAQHYASASELAPVAKRLEWAVRAAEEALREVAFEDAATHYSYALNLLSGPNTMRRFHLLLKLGAAQNGCGRWEDARATFESASRIAPSSDDFARAALGFRGLLDWTGPPDAASIKLLRAALLRIGKENTVARVLVLVALVKELYLTTNDDSRNGLAVEAEQVARAIGDEVALSSALEAGIYARWGADSARDTVSKTTRLIEIARKAEDRERAFHGYLLRYAARLQLGQVAIARDDARECARLSVEIGLPRYRWHMKVIDAGLAIARGEFDRVEDAVKQAYVLGERVHVPTAIHYRSLHLFLMGRWRDPIVEQDDGIAAGLERFPGVYLYELGCAWKECLAGRPRRGADLLERAKTQSLRDIPDNAFALLSLCGLAELAFRNNDVDAARLIYARSLRYARHYAVVSWGAACEGAIAHYLGMLATTLRHWDKAEELFASAVAMNQAMDFQPLVARSRHFYATMLYQRGRECDLGRATDLLLQAREMYRQLGMARCMEEAEELFVNTRFDMCDGVSAESGARSEMTNFVSAKEARAVAERGSVAPGRNIFRREGDYWTLAFEGTVSRFKDKRGLQYLAYLLANPFKQVHSLDLATGVGAKPVERPADRAIDASVAEGLRQGALGDLGPALDAKARNDYRRRLVDLKEELEQAEAFHDLGRVTILRRELDELTSYLTAASRPGRGSRLGGSYSERARVSVRNNIATAVRTIRTHNDALGRHLSNAVRTGTFCSYTPERKIRWDF